MSPRPCLFIVLLLSIAFSGVAGCGQQESEPTGTDTPDKSVKLCLNWTPSVEFMGFYAAVHKGYYRAEGLDVIFTHLRSMDSENGIPSLIDQGKFDIGIGGWELKTTGNMPPGLTVIAQIFRQNPSTFFALRGSGIKTPKDFRGRTVLVNSPTWKAMLSDFLTKHGMSLNDVTVVENISDLTPFLEGAVDIWCGYLINEAARAVSRGADITTFPLADYGIGTFGTYLYTRNEFLTAHPETARKFLRATIKGWDWTLQNHEEAAQLFSDKVKEDNSEYLKIAMGSLHPLTVDSLGRVGVPDCIRLPVSSGAIQCTDEYLPYFNGSQAAQ